jgi:hypothetical protein
MVHIINLTDNKISIEDILEGQKKKEMEDIEKQRASIVFPFQDIDNSVENIRSSEFFHRLDKSIEITFILYDGKRTAEVTEFIKTIQDHAPLWRPCDFPHGNLSKPLPTEPVRMATEVVVTKGLKETYAGLFNNSFYIDETETKLYIHLPLMSARGFFIYIITEDSPLCPQEFCLGICDIVQQDLDHIKFETPSGPCEIFTKNGHRYQEILRPQDIETKVI